MAGTIQQIAELAGVSRGTVDRALNHRGRVKPEVAERILRIADELEYRSNRRGRKGINSGRKIKIGVITLLCKTSFMIEVNEGIAKAKRELSDKNVELICKESSVVDKDVQIRDMDALVEAGVDGIAMMPVENEEVLQKINWLVEKKNIPVVTFNSDIIGAKRSCYIGMDNMKSGRMAAELIGKLTRGNEKILVITGHFTNSVNNRRVDGIVSELKKSYPERILYGVQSSYDDPKEVENIICNTMAIAPDLAGIVVASAGQAGIETALKKMQIEKRPYIVIYDVSPRNKRFLEEGIVDFLIDQEAYKQGYRAIYSVMDILRNDYHVKKECQFTNIGIKTKHNI